MQNAYQGPPQDFAMVVPVPVVLQKENVKTLTRDVFDRVDQLTAPRLVEYWEQNPCPEPRDDKMGMVGAMGFFGGRAMPASAPLQLKQAVKIEAQFTVGEYDIVVLSATDSSALDQWLHQNGYKIPPGAEPYLRPYVEMGMKFFVAKVDVSKVRMERIGNGPEQAVLSPLRFHYDSDAFRLPIRLGLINSAGTQDIVVTILARGQRYEVANYDNVAIPTNIDVADATRGAFAAFYATLFDDTARRHPRAVVTEYSWGANSCDPCPTPPLQQSDLMTLGADALPGAGVLSTPQDTTGFVITRLHARYSKDALGDDLVFRTAPAIAGGREFLQSGGRLEQGAQASSTNNFQARYAIRHPWTGPIACKEPRRGVWGGPPGADPWSMGPTPAARPAAKIGFVPRAAGLTLAAFVRGAVPPESLLTRSGPVLAMPRAAPLVDAGPPPADPGTPAPVPNSGPEMSPRAPTPPPPSPSPARGGCAGCSTMGRDPSTPGALASLLAIALAGFRRKRA
jgi:MYXO-CTERM domain-containing protein